jgi:hypothetical protein
MPRHHGHANWRELVHRKRDFVVVWQPIPELFWGIVRGMRLMEAASDEERFLGLLRRQCDVTDAVVSNLLPEGRIVVLVDLQRAPHEVRVRVRA